MNAERIQSSTLWNFWKCKLILELHLYFSITQNTHLKQEFID